MIRVGGKVWMPKTVVSIAEGAELYTAPAAAEAAEFAETLDVTPGEMPLVVPATASSEEVSTDEAPECPASVGDSSSVEAPFGFNILGNPLLKPMPADDESFALLESRGFELTSERAIRTGKIDELLEKYRNAP